MGFGACMSALASCILVPRDNPDYPATNAEVAAEYRRLRAEPPAVPTARPLVVLNGYRAPVWQSANLRSELAALTHTPRDRTLAISYFWYGSAEAVLACVREEVTRAFPDAVAPGGSGIDVVAISMGGIIARAAAIDDGVGPPLPIRRLFTLATPHRGADIAGLVAPDDAARSLRRGSALLRRVDEALAGAGYELVCYTRLRDGWVGSANTAPVGREPIWTPGLVVGSHPMVSYDTRILVDVARRLRGETPWAREGGPPPVD